MTTKFSSIYNTLIKRTEPKTTNNGEQNAIQKKKQKS